ncbi:hypothetical protein CHH83_02545 [Bacillus sp. 7586-K]|nr:hypothetical protein CHH83_02545 [Bacillus sp. 7586-K]
MDYFQQITSSLSISDLKILSYLADQNADALFKAIKKKSLQEEVDLSEANYRKSLYRLEALKFISIEAGQKEHSIYITEFGKQALYVSLSEEVI